MIKWIGQHIWDFVSRFRNDVYLENIADGTVDSDKFLGLDSNNKIVKETVSGGVSLGNDGNDRVVTATGGGALNGEANLTWNNIQLGLEYSGADGPTILLTKTGDNATAPIINFVAQRAASGGAANNDDDYLGYTRYWGYNNAGTPEAIKFAEIQAQISERDDGVEEGRLDLLVQAQGALRTGFSCVGNGGAIVDTTIGTGATSVTTVAGNLTAGGTILSGWHGSTTRIKLLHRDFIADDGGRPVNIDDTGEGSENFFLESFSSNPMYATVAIPTGFKATHVMVYGSATDAVEVWEHQINSKTGVSKGTGNVDTEIAITEVTSSTTNYLFIQVANASGNEVHGGYVTIAAV